MERPRNDRENEFERFVRSFDPMSGLEKMAAIQAEGLRAASALLERVIGSEPDYGGARSRAGAGPDYRTLVDAWTELLAQTVAGLAPPGPHGDFTAPIDRGSPGSAVRLDGDIVDVWLRNDGREDAGPISLFAGPLVDADDVALEGAEIGFEPRDIAVLPARSSRAVALSVDAGAECRPGAYRGAIQARGAPALWIPLEVVIGKP